MKTLSIIIPTLNEEEHLSKTLSSLKKLEQNGMELIIVDGGSTDRTVSIANGYNIKVIQTQRPGRALQMNEGAKLATGEYFCFLHADTLPPNNFRQVIEATLTSEKIVMGGFVSLMQGERTRYWFSFLNYIKTYLCPMFYMPMAFFGKGLKLLFGDQMMFCRREDYFKSGGFNPKVKVMEEADLCIRMNQLGKIKMVHQLIYSSDRRVKEWGFWKANKIYFYIAFGWAFGVSNDKLSRLYTEIR